MAELEFKYLNEIDISDSLTDSAHVIVEDGGNIRRAPMNQLVTGSGGVSSWNDLTDRPFYEENNQTVIEWDGNTEGREAAFTYNELTFYKVSDDIPTYDDLIIGEFFYSQPEGLVGGSLSESAVREGVGCYSIANNWVIVVLQTEFEIDETSLSAPSAGIYFGGSPYPDIYAAKLTYGSTTYHPLDEAFIPDTIARKTDVTWENLPDKPFGDNQTVIEWDGSTEGREAALADGEAFAYKISDATPSLDELLGATMKIYDNGELIDDVLFDQECIDLSKDDSTDSVLVVLPRGFSMYIALEDNAILADANMTFPTKGIYNVLTGMTSSLTYGSTKTIDSKYLPPAPVTSVNGMTGDVVIEGGSGGGVTSWNELEDKPFYEEGGLEAIIENESPEMTKYGDFLDCQTLIVPLVAGEKYKVILDGMEYQFTATEGELHGDQFVYIGSEQMFNDINAGTDGDFFIASVWENGQCVYTMFDYVSDTTSVTLSVYKDATVIRTLDPKFLPAGCIDSYTVSPNGIIRWDGDSTNRDTVDMNGNNALYDGKYIYTHVSDNIPSMSDLSGAIIRLTNSSTLETRTLTIESETCTTASATSEDDNTIIVSDGDGKEICFISSINNNACYTNYVLPKAGIYFVTTSTEYVSMLDYNTDSVDKISVEYLPKFDRHETVVIEWYDDITGNVSFTATTSIGEATLYQATPDNIKYSDVISAEVTIIDESTGEEEVKVISEDDIEQFDGGYFADMFAVSLRNDAIYNSNTLFAGIYLARFSDTKHVKSVRYYRAIERDLAEEINHLSVNLDSAYRETTKVHSWNDLTDKPFGEVEGQTVIEWDGNTENRDYCSVGSLAYYKVSDSIPDVSEIVNHTIAFGNHPLADTGDYLVNDAEVIVHSGGYKIDCVIVVQNTSMEISGNRYTFPSTGTYFGLNTDNGAFVKRFEYGNYTIQTIDEKYIPDSIARMEDVVTSVNGMTGDVVIGNEPFVQENVSTTIEWDGTTDKRDNVTVGSYGYCKVCDLPSDDVVVTSWTNSNGMTMSAGGSNFTITEGDGATNYANGVIVVKKTTFTLNGAEYTVPSTGLYFMYYGTMVHTATIAIEYEYTILGQKYISDDIARSASFHGLTVPDATGETVTAAEFNALLAALREAGYLAI